MALLELGGKRFPIPTGELALGSDAACGVVVTGSGVLPKHAVFQAQPDGQVVIRKATPGADVLINGVRLGAEPTPLLHGDKVEVGGHELTFVDERRSGSTQYVAAVKVPEGAAARTGPATANTGGRVVSLTDGREYVITGASLVFGREAGCDVVVGGKDVSRRHAEIVQTPKGYLVVDSSTNGTFVNEERVQGQRILARADVVRIGEESFRFYADTAAAAPAAPVAAPSRQPPGPAGPPPGPAASAPRAAPPPSQPAGGAAPGGPGGRPSQSGPLASLLVRGGALKGQRFHIKTPVVNIGRADYNDVVLPDASVSTSHAKLQRREGVWLLIDLDSTNGTFVDDEPVKSETPLAPGASVRFGDVPLVFEPTDDALGVAKGGGTVMLPTPAPAPPPPAPPARPAPRAPVAAPGKAAPKAPPPAKGAARPQPKRPQPPAAKKKGKGCGAAALVLLAGGAGIAGLVHWILA